MLVRIYELRKKVELFLEAQGNQNFLQLFTVDGFQLTLAYLVDILEALNLLNRHLQGSHTSCIEHYNSIRACV